jgi:NAD(P)H-hydrate epimerase
MQELEGRATAAGLAHPQMIENAGRAIAESVRRLVPELAGKRIAVLVGSGNNGADGMVAGAALAQAGAQVGVYLVKPRSADDLYVSRLRQLGSLVASADQDQRHRVLKNLIGSSHILIDAVLGTGFRLPLGAEVASVLSVAKSALDEAGRRPLIISVDCPSGVDCDTGQAAPEVLPADHTIALAAAKVGLLRFPAASLAGQIQVADIGIPGDPEAAIQWVEAEDIRRTLPRSLAHGHKGTYGRVLVIGGSANYPGAPVLAGLGAYRAGAGLVVLAVPSPVQIVSGGRLVEATWLLLPHETGVISVPAVDVLRPQVGSADCVVIGPGLGTESITSDFLTRLLGLGGEGEASRIGFRRPRQESAATEPPKLGGVVVDADALKLLARHDGWWKSLPRGTILTPHPGEMAILRGVEVSAVQADRLTMAARAAAEWSVTLVLKGAYTVVASPGKTAVIPFATRGLAHAGTGDVLAGAIAALRAQGLAAHAAAVAGAYLHGLAGTLARPGEEESVLAAEVAEALPRALRRARGDR